VPLLAQSMSCDGGRVLLDWRPCVNPRHCASARREFNSSLPNTHGGLWTGSGASDASPLVAPYARKRIWLTALKPHQDGVRTIQIGPRKGLKHEEATLRLRDSFVLYHPHNFRGNVCWHYRACPTAQKVIGEESRIQ